MSNSTINQSIVEDAALEWFGKQYRFAPTLSQREKEKENYETIWRPNPTLSEEARASHANSAIVQTVRKLKP
jgi:hypothetical protein